MSTLLRWALALSSAVILTACASMAPAPVTVETPVASADDCACPNDGEEGMTMYPLVLLKAGPRRHEELSDDEATRLQAAHRAHIRSMAEAGHLLIAGPMGALPGDDPIIGIFVFRSGHEEAAQTLPAEDPLVKAGRLRFEYIPWYGPLGLTYNGDPGPLN
ncbi:MAG: hypothetical protein DHS20C15_25400 [Planctomycetota bacterium]|nr:MAG: hypothetical protein DHS20C15_25400 [Planctomycetota bacterium]